MTTRWRFQKGVSFAELILVIAAVAFLGLIISNLPSSVATINKSRHASIAQEIATREVDYLRKQTYANLPNGINTFSDSNLSSLPGATATYEIKNCPAEICTSQEMVKQLEVKVSWKEGGDSKNVDLVTLIGEGGVGQ